MKKLFLSAAALAVASGAALAADLPSRKGPPVLPPPPPPPPMWSGFYVGLNAGYGFGGGAASNSVGFSAPYLPASQNWRDGGLAVSNGVGLATSGGANMDQNGFIGGGQIGYNYQWGQSFVVGVEVDMQGTGIRGSGRTSGVGLDNVLEVGGNRAHFGATTGSNGVNAGIDWMGTVRGRLGYLFTPTLLIYGTGGFSYGGGYADVTTWASTRLYNHEGRDFGTQTFLGGSRQSNTLVGWNGGGGFEWMMMPNWSIKAEAIYYDLGSVSVPTMAVAAAQPQAFPGAGGVPAAAVFGNTRVRYDGIIARAGVNYHFNWASTAPAFAKF